jgi:hypothetical protein
MKLSVGQVAAAIRAEAAAIGVKATVIRMRDAGNSDSSLSPDTRLSRDVAAIILVALLALVLWIAAAHGREHFSIPLYANIMARSWTPHESYSVTY